ncbi:MAG: LrgB family protein [Defluviitaleaceae bacterium]|nr:LrgB family protein [Defluviitaleaceae bacterium]
MNALFDLPLLGILLCCAAYTFGTWLNKKTGWVMLNPFLIAMLMCMAFLQLTGMSLEQFNRGASILQFFLIPATCAIAVSIYRQRKLLGAYFLPVVLGCLVSSLVSIGASYVLGFLFGLDEVMVASTVPSSVTAPIAIDIAVGRGGIVPIAILCVAITGIAGAIFSPTLIKLFNITDPVEMGVAIGASSHVLGTSKALELGEVQGAMSGIAIGISGIITVFLSLLI